MTVSPVPSPKEGPQQCTVIDTDSFSGFKQRVATADVFPRSIYIAASMTCWPLADDREQLQTVMWLGRQDSNLGMAESKSAALPLGSAPSGGSHAAAARGP